MIILSLVSPLGTLIFIPFSYFVGIKVKLDRHKSLRLVTLFSFPGTVGIQVDHVSLRHALLSGNWNN